MKDVELLADLVAYLTRCVHDEVEGLSQEEITWQPDAQGNSIGVTVWHFSRWFDVLTIRAFENRSPQEEQWYTRGWMAKTGYNPQGIGYQGLGVLTDYTPAEVAAVPVLSADELLTYHDQVSEALHQYLLSMPEGALYQPSAGLSGKRTQYEWVRSIVMGSFRHVGEIAALNAMRRRARVLD